MAEMTLNASGSVKRALVGVVFGSAMFLMYTHNTPSGYDMRWKPSDITVWAQSVRTFGLRVWTNAPRLRSDGPRIMAVSSSPPSQASKSWDYTIPAWTGNEAEPPRDDVAIQQEPAQSVPASEKPVAESPAKSPVLVKPTQGPLAAGFGIRNHPIEKSVKLHKGIDIAGNEGDHVLAALPGTVAFAGSAGTLGIAVIMQHEDGRVTKYGHMSKVLVKNGERLVAGQRLGLVGHTGEATGPHLHFEFWVKGSPVDPIGYFASSRNGM